MTDIAQGKWMMHAALNFWWRRGWETGGRTLVIDRIATWNVRFLKR